MTIYDEDDQTVYIYYLNNRLYAWTTQKNDKEFFEAQRNMNVFLRKKKTLSPIQFHAFMQKYKRYQIIEIPVSSKGKDFSIFGTYYEDEELSNMSENLICQFEELDTFFNSLCCNPDISKKYYDAIFMLLEYWATNNKTNTSEFMVDSLSMFYSLFKNTF